MSDAMLEFLKIYRVNEFLVDAALHAHYEMPHTVFSLARLKHLFLGRVDIQLPPAFQEFSVLVELQLMDVLIAPAELQRFISQCPMLEILRVDQENDYTLYSLDINAPNLKELRLKGMFHSISLETPSLEDLYLTYGNTNFLCDDIKLPESNGDDESNLIKVFGHLPLLRRFEGSIFINQFLAVGGVPDELPSKLYSLTHLQLDHIDLGVFDNVAYILCLIRSSPNLESLDLSFHTFNECIWPRNASTIEQREHEQQKSLKFLMAVRKNGIILDRLSTVDITGCSICEVEEEFVKLILLTVAGNEVQRFKVGFHEIYEAVDYEAIIDKLKMFHQSFSEKVSMEISWGHYF